MLRRNARLACSSILLAAAALPLAAQIPADHADLPRPGPAGTDGQRWCWVAPRADEPPPASDPRFAREPIDRFVHARLAAAGLSAAPPAEPATWLRRVSFDLCGLPPTLDELDAFLADPSPDARARVVDRLLASPQFGERWARHWMDLVRYADSMGHEFDFEILGAWRYRDWLIDAFNRDLPYDRFVVEHLAGDLLEAPRRDPDSGLPISALGTTGLLLHEEKHAPIDTKQAESDRLDNVIDVVSKTFLGVTLACARCHDHKFDPIPTSDYYSIYGVLASARSITRVLEPSGVSEQRATLAALAHERDALALQTARTELPARYRDWLAADPARLTALAALRPPALAAERDDDLVIFDAGETAPPSGHRHGPALVDAHVPVGPYVVQDQDGTTRVRAAPRALLHSARRAPREPGSQATRSFRIGKRYLHLLAAGRRTRFTVVLDGFRLVRGPIYDQYKQELGSDELRWHRVDLEMTAGRRAHVEFADLPAADPADPLHEGGWGNDGWFAVASVLLSDSPHAPEAPALPSEWVASPDRAAAALSRALAPGAEARELAVLDQAGLALPLEAAALRAASAAVSAAAEAIPEPILVTTLAEGDAVDEPIHVRGGTAKLGEPVPHRDLTALGGAALSGAGHGRLDWARRIASADHPLTARVLVNRVWHHLFGRGLVGSVDNFGKLGEEPTHPELLDWLARRFVEDDWSIKQLIRRIVLSETYGLASAHADAASAERAATLDPGIALLHRARVRRLQGEAIRDAMLALSGRLDLTRCGPSVPVHLTPFMDGRGRPSRSGPADGAGRRSVYLEVRRNFLDPFFLAFDQPIPATTMGARSVSNVPGQALALLNDPFAMEQAARWSQRIVASSGGDAAHAVGLLYRGAFARRPSEPELAAALAFLGEQPDETAWRELAHVLFNVKDFVFLE
ncbi:MAG: DUF1549 domain-containing protein [Planctomycetes bacterium]|nr:DUF1549 domain-containing protein [Planctomycetota bacterium]